MTETDKELIYEMRIKGLGYKAIAALLGLSRDSVKTYCKRNHLSGNGQVVSLNVEEIKNRSDRCACCGKELKQKEKGRAKRFCSEACRRKWWKDNPDKKNKGEDAMYKYTCPYCGKEFSVYGNTRRKFCSHNCYIKSRFWEGEDDGF